MYVAIAAGIVLVAAIAFLSGRRPKPPNLLSAGWPNQHGTPIGKTTGCINTNSTWWTQALPTPLKSDGTIVFDSTAALVNADHVVGMGAGNPTTYSDLTGLYRYGTVNGLSQAYNGATGMYVPGSGAPYGAGSKITVEFDVHFSSKTYDAFYTPPGGVKNPLGIGLGFRATAAEIDSLGGATTYGVATVCNVAVYAGGPTPPVPPASGTMTINTLPGTVVVSGTYGGGAITEKFDSDANHPVTMTLTGLIHAVVLSWAASTTPQVTSYSVFRSSSPGIYGNTPLGSTGTLTYTDTTVLSGQTYYYVVQSVAGSCPSSPPYTVPCGPSANSNEIKVVVPTP
jgi:hypothetical protein